MSSEPGAKHDEGKLRWSLLPTDAIESILRVLEKGAQKYSAGGWEFVPNARERYWNAAQRHLWAWWNGEDNDPEWNLPHLAHAGCCVIFLLALQLREKQRDRVVEYSGSSPPIMSRPK